MFVLWRDGGFVSTCGLIHFDTGGQKRAAMCWRLK
jgi:hypothetical protein